MSEFERTFQYVTQIKIDSDGLRVFWLDEKKDEQYVNVEENIFVREFSIVGKLRGENAGITIKVEG